MTRSDTPLPDEAAWRERLTAYLDGELSPADSREVLAWLKTHPAALRELEEDRRVWALLAAYRDEAVPAGFSDRVLAKAGAAPGAAARPGSLALLAGGRARRYAAMAASVVLALGVGALASNRLFRSPASSAAGSSALDAVPAALLDSDDDVTKLASLSDDEFEALLHDDPDKLVQAVR